MPEVPTDPLNLPQALTVVNKDADATIHQTLSRFQSDPYRPPNLWFDDALRVVRQRRRG